MTTSLCAKIELIKKHYGFELFKIIITYDMQPNLNLLFVS